MDRQTGVPVSMPAAPPNFGVRPRPDAIRITVGL